VSGLCAMVKREVWDKVGGWDESAPDAAVDVDLCLRLGDAGYRVVHTPDVTVRLHRPFPDVVIPPTSSDPYFSRYLAPDSGTWGMEAPKGGTGVG
jgi:hypothetical protein